MTRETAEAISRSWLAKSRLADEVGDSEKAELFRKKGQRWAIKATEVGS